MPVVYGYWSARTRTAITISSNDALPARSPIPLMVHSTWRAPAATAASELATARPRSLWQCAEMTTPCAPRTRGGCCESVRRIRQGRCSRRCQEC